MDIGYHYVTTKLDAVKNCKHCKWRKFGRSWHCPLKAEGLQLPVPSGSSATSGGPPGGLPAVGVADTAGAGSARKLQSPALGSPLPT